MAENQDLKGWMTPLLVGLAVYWVTTQDDRQVDSSVSLSSVEAQVEFVRSELAQVRQDLRSVNQNLSSVRTDPFTGTDGLKLERNLVSALREGDNELQSDFDRRFDKIEKRLVAGGL